MRPILHLLLLTMFAFTVTGCITCQECGSLKRNHDITRLFLEGEVVPGYSYYYSGPEQRPSAVMAIDSSYTVVAEFWKPVEGDEEELSGWILNATNWKGVKQQGKKSGAEILSPEGEQIGIFYSKYDKLVTKFQSDKDIQVYPPSYLDGSSTADEDRSTR